MMSKYPIRTLIEPTESDLKGLSVDGKKVQQIIIKFLTWQKWNVVYRSRKVVKEKFGYSVRLNLTKKN